MELRKNGTQLEKERTAGGGGREKRETTPSVDTATPDMWMCETDGNAGQLPGVDGEKWNSVCPIFNMFFVRILISLYVL